MPPHSLMNSPSLAVETRSAWLQLPLIAAGYEAWPLIICGVLKMAYDVALLWIFRHTKPPEGR